MAYLAIYLLPLVLIWAGLKRYRQRREAAAVALREDHRQAGLTEPSSLHPVIDPAKCIGCATCVTACPEGQILGLVDGKAHLIAPSMCIGHGACADACPMGAIELVFGTERRGVEIPQVGPDFQTNVPGIWIAGELGGMGLIRNAIEQGRQAVAEIARHARATPAVPGALDLAIIGAGPAGLSASLAAKEAGLRFVTLEQDSLGGTVAHFPRGKLVMTRPAVLPLHGPVNLTETSKEALLAFWQDVVRRFALRIHFEERVDSIAAEGGAFRITTTNGSHLAAHVLLAIGRRGTPRQLGVPGEELSKVVYRLADPEQYQGQHVLVVGGGDSALEAVIQLAEAEGTVITLCYRGTAIQRAKPKNRDKFNALVDMGRVTQLFGTEITRIDQGRVALMSEGAPVTIRNDAVIVCAGGILPTEFLKSIGIRIEMKHGKA